MRGFPSSLEGMSAPGCFRSLYPNPAEDDPGLRISDVGCRYPTCTKVTTGNSIPEARCVIKRNMSFNSQDSLLYTTQVHTQPIRLHSHQTFPQVSTSHPVPFIISSAVMKLLNAIIMPIVCLHNQVVKFATNLAFTMSQR
jgi:hypothetical protein